jgi:dTDP-4-amino-4,6-dideoxygalactose transaminase
LHHHGIGAQVHYVPLTRHPTFGLSAAEQATFSNAESAYEELLSIPLHPGLTEREQDHVAHALEEAIAR